jgi:hypothetical protein
MELLGSNEWSSSADDHFLAAAAGSRCNSALLKDSLDNRVTPITIYKI